LNIQPGNRNEHEEVSKTVNIAKGKETLGPMKENLFILDFHCDRQNYTNFLVRNHRPKEVLVLLKLRNGMCAAEFDNIAIHNERNIRKPVLFRTVKQACIITQSF
jgi:hypothetical protein